MADYIGQRSTIQSVTTLHVDLGHEWRGGQSQALLLIEGLHQSGHRAELIARHGSPLARRARAAGVVVHEVTSRLGASLMIRRHRTDIVHCHEAHALTSAWLAGLTSPVRFVASRRVAYPISRSPLARLRYTHAARIIAVSQFVKQSVIESGFPADRVDVVYDGVELPELTGTAQRDNAPLIGCVGYLLPEKNQALLVRAMPFVLEQYPSCRLLVAGDGPCRGELEQLARELGVAAAVDFAGFVDNVAAAYPKLDIFAFPSVAEPLGSSLLAAMSFALPVAALAAGAVPEIIEDERNGLLVAQPAPRAMADAILRLLGDAALRNSLGAAARRTVERRFLAERMTCDTLGVYCSVTRTEALPLGRSGRPAARGSSPQPPRSPS